jgi:hypothetical protein
VAWLVRRVGWSYGVRTHTNVFFSYANADNASLVNLMLLRKSDVRGTAPGRHEAVVGG